MNPNVKYEDLEKDALYTFVIFMNLVIIKLAKDSISTEHEFKFQEIPFII